jgi:DNA-binding CsgD family transcriptional regulator
MRTIDHAFFVLVNIPASNWCYKVTCDHKVIGRSPEAQIRIPACYNRVSRRHAELWCDGKGFWLRDCTSRGGTQINGVWLQSGKTAQVAIGDRVTLSDTEFELRAKVNQLAEIVAEVPIEASIELGSQQTSVFDTTEKAEGNAKVVQARLLRLTPAELEVLLWMCRGLTDDDDLGRKLFRSPHTVRTQVGSILQKLEVHSRIGVINWLKQAQSSDRCGHRFDASNTSHDMEARRDL